MLISSGRNWDLWEEMPFLGTALKHYDVSYRQGILSEMGGEQITLWLHLVHKMCLPGFASVLCFLLCVCAEYLRKWRHVDHEWLPPSPLFPAKGVCVCCWDLQLVVSFFRVQVSLQQSMLPSTRRWQKDTTSQGFLLWSILRTERRNTLCHTSEQRRRSSTGC